METCPSSCAVFLVQWGHLSTKEKQCKQVLRHLTQEKGAFLSGRDQKPDEEDSPVHKAWPTTKFRTHLHLEEEYLRL